MISKEMQAILDSEREEGKVEGIKKGKLEGRKEGKLDALLNLFNRKIIDLATAAKELKMSEKEFLKLAK